MVYVIYPRCYKAEPSNPKGITYTIASEGSMWPVPQLTAFQQSQAGKSLAELSCQILLDNTFLFRQLREQRLEKCGLCPITLHLSRHLIRGRQATVVQPFYIKQLAIIILLPVLASCIWVHIFMIEWGDFPQSIDTEEHPS